MPVNTLAQLGFVLTINQKKNPANNVAEFVEMMKAKGEKMTYGIPTTTSQACAALFIAAAGSARHAGRLQDHAGGDLRRGRRADRFRDVGCAVRADAGEAGQGENPRRRDGQAQYRVSGYSDLAEQGINNAELPPWWAVYAPAEHAAGRGQETGRLAQSDQRHARDARISGAAGRGAAAGHDRRAPSKKLADEIVLWEKIIKIAKFETQQ